MLNSSTIPVPVTPMTQTPRVFPYPCNTLLPMEGHRPTYAQLYIYDPTSITDMAMRNPLNNRLDVATMATLHDMLDRNNQLTHIYKKALELTNNVPAGQHQQVIL